MNKYTELIAVVRENPSELERWLVFADKLMEDGNAHGEAIAGDVALCCREITGKKAQQVRKSLLNERKKVWKEYAGKGKKIPSYFIENDDLWMGAFPLRFPNPHKLKELDGAFAEEFLKYEIMPQTNTYALGVHQLRIACEAEENTSHPTFVIDGKTVYRPLTFRENIQARVEDFYTLYDANSNKRTVDDRLRLFNTWLDSCAGIAYKADSPEFKLILQSPHLIGINESFNNEFIPIDYDSVDGIRLNRNNGIYNPLLTQEQVLNHPAWLAAVEEDKPLLQEYTNIVFSQTERKNMGFYLETRVTEDKLRVLFVYELDIHSSASGCCDLSDGGTLLRVSSSSFPDDAFSGHVHDVDLILESGHHGVPFRSYHTHEDSHALQDLSFAGHTHEDYLSSDFKSIISDEVIAAARNRPNNIDYNRSGSRTNGSLTPVDRPETLRDDLVYYNQTDSPVMRINLLNQRPVIGREGRALLTAILRRPIIV
ncbi:MAG: hypothetical protein Q8R37_04080 [Nanoarchaeota archaeon]|nr:hypothetical protein [Nanoarchaeota archaeon]